MSANIWREVMSLVSLIEREAESFVTSTSKCVEKAELIQEGLLAAHAAARCYDPSYGSSLWTYARSRVIGSFKDHRYRTQGWRRHWGRYRANRRSGRRAWGGQGESLSVSDRWHVLHDSVRREWIRQTRERQLPNPEQAAIKMDARESVRWALQRLPKMDFDLMAAIYFEGKSLSDVARLYGVSRSTISRRHTALLVIMRGWLLERYAIVAQAALARRNEVIAVCEALEDDEPLSVGDREASDQDAEVCLGVEDSLKAPASLGGLPSERCAAESGKASLCQEAEEDVMVLNRCAGLDGERCAGEDTVRCAYGRCQPELAMPPLMQSVCADISTPLRWRRPDASSHDQSKRHHTDSVAAVGS